MLRPWMGAYWRWMVAVTTSETRRDNGAELTLTEDGAVVDARPLWTVENGDAATEIMLLTTYGADALPYYSMRRAA